MREARGLVVVKVPNAEWRKEHGADQCAAQVGWWRRSVARLANSHHDRRRRRPVEDGARNDDGSNDDRAWAGAAAARAMTSASSASFTGHPWATLHTERRLGELDQM